MRRMHKHKIDWTNVGGGVLIGILVVGAALAALYYYAVFMPSQRKVEDVIRANQIEVQFRRKYCATRNYPNKFVRDICNKRTPF